ncbi:Putative exporter of polyketide antibiotics- like protein [Kribbella flavida DSM 17836]|uniref:Putative exporter of polyketide antibiotics-like protein n=1 Tax=Kribbella flavida (strain DSM 17836 / JCM 10339 / NBRC 14399) TaxID=479435 RepID=D2Q4R3_KRIFD|nr:exporter of polyketide antibiotics-like protein [Kribbella flavida]ADB34168.1 Putative exporter of polyketide antibiotics- like protein [Kribbella flavida DSM 17836]
MRDFVGTSTLVRLALRRDRVLIPVWIVVFVSMAAGSAQASIDLYPDVQSRVEAATTSNSSPALVSLYGRIFDPTSLGELSLFKLTAFGALLVALLAAMIVVRHTRAEEETGRLELLSAGVLGRYAALTAALIVSALTAVLLSLLTALSLIAVGLPASGSFAFGLVWASAGLAFAGVGAVAAQLTEGARAANGLTAVVLGVAYVLRAVGDSSAAWVSWLSPIGWSQQIRAYAGDRFVVALAPLALLLVLVAAAYALIRRRDIGAGLVRPRPGPATAAASLRSPLALAWRLHRGALAGWGAAFLLLGFVVGNIASNVDGFASSENTKEMIQKLGGVNGLTDAFLSTEMGMLGLLASAFGIQAALRLRSEETALRAEPLLATGVTRAQWVSSHLLMALLGTGALIVVGGLGAGISSGAELGDMGRQVPRLLAAAVVQLPAIWLVTAVVVLFFGLVPKLVTAAWGVFGAFLLIGQFGPVFGLPESVMDLSPYGHTPRLPGGDFSATPVVALAAIACALALTGYATFRRRDLG